jgi:hypothetical protein
MHSAEVMFTAAASISLRSSAFCAAVTIFYYSNGNAVERQGRKDAAEREFKEQMATVQAESDEISKYSAFFMLRNEFAEQLAHKAESDKRRAIGSF